MEILLKEEKKIQTKRTKTDVVDNNLEQASGDNGDSPFAGLDLHKLLKGPLDASIQAQEQLAKPTQDFIDNCGVESE